MITLSEAFKLCQIGECLVCLRTIGKVKSKDHYLMSAKIRDKFDMEKIKVACIRPKLARCSPYYECMKFVVVGVTDDELREEEYRE